MAQSSTIMRLFTNVESPCGSPAWNDSDLEQVMNSFGKGSNFSISRSRNDNSTPKKGENFVLIDEDSGLGMENEMEDDGYQLSAVSSFLDRETGHDLNGSFSEMSASRTPFSLRRRSNFAKKKLFTNKRAADLPEVEDDISPSAKKFRQDDQSLLKFVLKNSPGPKFEDLAFSEPEADVQSIIMAVDRLTTEVDLVADGSRGYSLPTVVGKHGDLKAISCHTMAELVGKNNDVTIVDCRYPYEYEGGHIMGAVNMYTKDEVHKLLELPEADRPRVIVFHCEFSSERGPKLYRFLRSCDRELNKDHYPRLNFPEIYILEGGYKEFFQNYQDLCDPKDYKPMLHKDHSSDLRHFRVKSKSWAGGQKGKQPRRSRLSRSCLSFNNV